jgi:hypothetical protein
MVKASRGAAGANPAPAGAAGASLGTVDFEIVVNFRPPISPAAEKQILRQLGAEGLVRRWDLLQKEGLL